MITRLKVKITDTAFPKMMEIPVNKRVTLGRSDIDAPSVSPDIDFVAFNAIVNGISRSHAAIAPQTDGKFVLIDLGSRNGTKLNGHTLNAHQPYPITDGDEIYIGNLRTVIYFE
jgi:pSer/pThr/pTyr-binding forkhead associated (FHA) protein